MSRVARASSYAAGLVTLTVVVGAIVVLRSGASTGPQPSRSEAGAAISRVGSSDAPVAPTVVVVGQEVVQGDCVTHSTVYDRITPTIAQQTRSSDLSIVGTVGAVQAPRWNTPDGGPANKQKSTATSVYRLVTISVETTIKGSAAGTVQLRFPGGRAGCEAWVAEDIPLDLAPGDRLVLFVQDFPAADTASSAPTIVSAWPVGSDGVVSTPADGKVPIADLVAGARAAAQGG
jgi:hypothetical protein